MASLLQGVLGGPPIRAPNHNNHDAVAKWTPSHMSFGDDGHILARLYKALGWVERKKKQKQPNNKQTNKKVAWKITLGSILSFMFCGKRST